MPDAGHQRHRALRSLARILRITKRLLIGLLAAATAALCVLGLSARSRRLGLEWSWHTGTSISDDGSDGIELIAMNHWVGLKWFKTDEAFASNRPGGRWIDLAWRFEFKNWRGADEPVDDWGFDYERARTSGILYASTKRADVGYDLVRVPTWFALLLTAATPVFVLTRWIVRYRRRHVIKQRCPTCGYDLRATPDRCPECGTAVSFSTDANAGARHDPTDRS